MLTWFYLEAAEDFFNGNGEGADALLLTEEEGAAYAYRYPQYGVVTTARRIGLPAAYPVPKGDIEMMEFVSNWIALKKSEGTVDYLYEYWMHGGADRSQSSSLVCDSRCAGLGGLTIDEQACQIGRITTKL